MELTPEKFVKLLTNMKERGSSVDLNWGEDNEMWECSWITSGVRYTGFSERMEEAALRAYYKARGRTWLDLGPDER